MVVVGEEGETKKESGVKETGKVVTSDHSPSLGVIPNLVMMAVVTITKLNYLQSLRPHLQPPISRYPLLQT